VLHRESGLVIDQAQESCGRENMLDVSSRLSIQNHKFNGALVPTLTPALLAASNNAFH
jgi:hypothetical protein